MTFPSITKIQSVLLYYRITINHSALVDQNDQVAYNQSYSIKRREDKLISLFPKHSINSMWICSKYSEPVNLKPWTPEHLKALHNDLWQLFKKPTHLQRKSMEMCWNFTKQVSIKASRNILVICKSKSYVKIAQIWNCSIALREKIICFPNIIKNQSQFARILLNQLT